MNYNSNQMFQPLPQPPPMTSYASGGVLGANNFNYRMPNNRMNYRQMNDRRMDYQMPNNRMNYRPMNYRMSNNQMIYPQPNYQWNNSQYVRSQWNNNRIPYNRNNYRIFQNNNRRNALFNPNSNRQNLMFNPNSNRQNLIFNRRNSSVNRNNQIEQEQQQRRPGRPRVLRLNDFMPPPLRDPSPNVMVTSTTNTRPQTPIDELPQREIFSNTAPMVTTATTTNDTQPFETNIEIEPLQPRQQQQRQERTTSPYRRRQNRNQQRQYRETIQNNNENRFNVLIDETGQDDIQEDQDELNVNNKVKPTEKRKKQRVYLEHNRIMSYLQKNFSTAISSRGNQAYVRATAPIYDEWVRQNYELQVWQAYFKLGTEQNHWAKAVIQRTRKRDQVTCTRFVQKKINQISAKIAEANAKISDLQIQLNIYWAQLTSNMVPTGQATTTTTESLNSTPLNNQARNRDPVDRIEKIILRYIHQCTQHVKKISENKVKLARAQMEEYKALQDFEQIATPLQWNVHLTLKPKMKLWSTKNKNLQVALKRVEYDLPPNFIGKTDFQFKIDESIIGQDEAQEIYNQMRRVTKDYRTKAMTVYVQALTREQELLSNEIKQIIDGFPKENEDDRIDSQPSIAAFKQYHDLREKRINLEVEQAVYFLDGRKVEGEPDNPDQPIVAAPTITRSLGEDFLLQL